MALLFFLQMLCMQCHKVVIIVHADGDGTAYLHFSHSYESSARAITENIHLFFSIRKCHAWWKERRRVLEYVVILLCLMSLTTHTQIIKFFPVSLEDFDVLRSQPATNC